MLAVPACRRMVATKESKKLTNAAATAHRGSENKASGKNPAAAAKTPTGKKRTAEKQTSTRSARQHKQETGVDSVGAPAGGSDQGAKDRVEELTDQNAAGDNTGNERIAAALRTHIEGILEKLPLDVETKQKYVTRARKSLTESLRGEDDLRARLARWQGRLEGSMLRAKRSIPSLEELERIANAALRGLPSNLTLAWAPLGCEAFRRPVLGGSCHTVEIQAVASMKLGWYTPKVPGTDRVTYGSMVLGPSGIGKTYLMVHQLPEQLAKACAPSQGQEPAVLLTLCATLGGLLPKVGLDPATAKADKVFDCIEESVKQQVPTSCDKYCKANARKNAGACRLFIHLVIDEIGVCPGLFSAEERFTRLVSTIWDAVHQRVGNKKTIVLLGVHVSVGGTAAESPVVRLASNLDTVKKIRLEHWSAATATISFLCTTPLVASSCDTWPVAPRSLELFSLYREWQYRSSKR
jgi:hypothetical protein